jgi:hypothetical protein
MLEMKQIFFGFLGGLLACALWSWIQKGKHAVSETASKAERTVDVQNAAVVKAEEFQLLDREGNLRAQLAMAREGGPGLFFYDSQRRLRLVLGVYPPGEGDLPFVVLNDSDQNAAGLFRLVGNHQVPYVIFKKGGRDRGILGLTGAASDRVFFSEHGNSGTRYLIGGQ